MGYHEDDKHGCRLNDTPQRFLYTIEVIERHRVEKIGSPRACQFS